jgi:release factor glutamine methyltransferase
VRRLAEVLRLSAGFLEDRGSPSARLDAEVLLAHALGISRVELYTQHDRPLSEPELAACRALLQRRAAREPVAYIVGRRRFRRLDLAVDGRVLIPRPETEELVEACLELLRGLERPSVLDVGTGSGAIALAIADEHAGARVCACDSSPAALAVAARNAGRAGIALELVESDLLAGLAGRRFDLIVANPPYVAAGELERLEPEVARFEPRAATVAGADGLDVFRRLLPQLPAHLEPAGRVALECGAGQAGWVAAELERLGLRGVFRRRDLSGRERMVGGALP